MTSNRSWTRPCPTFESGGCFVAGTRVLTDKGAVPIEAIQVGDMVWSQPEATGVCAYKRVIRKMVFDKKTIRSISYRPLNRPDFGTYDLYATENHPFWVDGKGWTRADLVAPGDSMKMGDGALAEVIFNLPIFRTNQPGVGWVAYGEFYEDGAEIDFHTGEILGNQVSADQDIQNGDDPYLKTRVYNFEVEQFHTYYVGGGAGGVWVRAALQLVAE